MHFGYNLVSGQTTTTKNSGGSLERIQAFELAHGLAGLGTGRKVQKGLGATTRREKALHTWFFDGARRFASKRSGPEKGGLGGGAEGTRWVRGVDG